MAAEKEPRPPAPESEPDDDAPRQHGGRDEDEEDDDEAEPAPGEAPAETSVMTSVKTSDGASNYRPSFVFLGIVALVSLVLDLGTKHWAKARLEAPEPPLTRRIEVIEGHFDLIFARNKGGAFGFLQGADESLRKPFFLLVSLAAVVFIFSLYRKLARDQWALKWGLPLVLGGALGNLVDRIRYGYVVDFIDLYVTVGGEEKHWPTFNVADIAIVVGVGLMAIDMFTARKAEVPDGLPELGEGEAAAPARKVGGGRQASRPAKGA